ncbi:MAG: hypothetical protein ACK559_30695, partial [bacterium]
GIKNIEDIDSTFFFKLLIFIAYEYYQKKVSYLLNLNILKNTIKRIDQNIKPDDDFGKLNFNLL